MRIALIGYGKMGKAIEKIASGKGHEIVLKINSRNADSFSENDLKGADVAFEFSRPETAYDNVMKCFLASVPVVCGSTGWQEKLKDAENFCRLNNKSFFYATNFSIGVNLFFEINILLARLMNSQAQYDEILLFETHHTQKRDSPSGTAITIAEQILNEVKRLSRWKNYKTNEDVNLENESESDNELPIFSTREEEVPGTHIVKYFSDVDEIEITHKALSREGFALGALSAGEWLLGKKGIFRMNDLLKH